MAIQYFSQTDGGACLVLCLSTDIKPTAYDNWSLIETDTGKLFSVSAGNWAETPPGAAAWGSITGTLSEQTDVQTALDAKSASNHNHDATYEAKNANIQTHIASAHAPSDAQKNSDVTKAEIEAKLTGEISSHTHAGGSEAFPIGSVFTAVVSTAPATLLGYGTWSAFGAGKMLVGLDSGDTDFDTAEETGGAKTVTLTTAQLPAHNHQILRERSATTGGATTQIARTADTSSTVDTNVFTENTGSGQAHPNLPPYIVVYLWKRTA